MGVLQEGTKAPDFSLSDKEGKIYRRDSLPGKYHVLFFYPKDNTPGCTLEAIGFTKLLSKFSSLGVSVVGISGGDSASKEKFCAAHDLSVLLLSDTEFKVAKAYGVFGEKKFMGRSYMGIHRTTYILSQKGEIVRVFASVKPEDHPQEVLQWLSSTLKKRRSSPVVKSTKNKRPSTSTAKNRVSSLKSTKRRRTATR